MPRTGSDVQGLKVTTFGALHRESEAKKFVIKLPNLNQVLDTVNFEIQTLPDDFQEALKKCQQTKELIYDSYKQQMNNHLMGKQEENKNSNSNTAGSLVRRMTEQTFLEIYHHQSTKSQSTVSEENKQASAVSAESEG